MRHICDPCVNIFCGMGSKNTHTMNREFCERFFVSAGDTDAEGRMSLPLLTSKIIDVATAHANSLGIGNPSMVHLHRGWVLSRLAIELKEYPRVNGEYQLTTWVETWNRRFSERCFELSDAEGRPMGYARSIWMVLDTETHESCDLTHLSLSEEMVSDRDCPIAHQGRHHTIVEQDAEEVPRGGLKATAPVQEYRFQYCDLDFYRHVNTVRYVQMLLNRFTLEEFDRMEVARMELTFMHECHYGQRIRILRADEEDQTSFALVNPETNEAALFASLKFVPITSSGVLPA